jgi:cyclopropane fatty-acyl-phospholipid synthase-like methyltransferase
MTADLSHFERMRQRYLNRDMPWDHELPPPEVIAVAERLAPGRLIDLGCGTGRASIYMAARGWQADAVDFVPEAIDMAREKVTAARLQQQIRLHVGSVTAMPFLHGPYDLAIDVGCFHGLAPADQQQYATEVSRLLRSGALLLLFVHLREDATDQRPAGTPVGSVEQVFSPTFSIAHVEHGETTVADLRWASAWYELLRR